MDFQFGAPGDVGEAGPLGGDRVPSGEAVGPFLSDAVAGMVGSGGVLVAERERGRRRRRRGRGRELRASVVVESKGQGSSELGNFTSSSAAVEPILMESRLPKTATS